MWTEENLHRKSRRGGGRRISAKKKGGGSYVNHYAESFESLTLFPKGVTADRGMFYVVGVARLRQLRVKRGNCMLFFNPCLQRVLIKSNLITTAVPCQQDR